MRASSVTASERLPFLRRTKHYWFVSLGKQRNEHEKQLDKNY
jgi:hypothetical protein